jgi:ACS family hexuronate transporter-like MFS transporter
VILGVGRDPPRARAAAGARPPSTGLSVGQALRRRNIWVCAAIAVLMVSFLFVCLTFLKLFLVEVRGFDSGVAAGLIGALGLSAIVSSFLIPGLSDRFGRRPVMILTPLVGVVLPLAAMYFHGSTWMLGALFMIGWLPLGCFPLFMATIPSEAVEPRQMATALGVVMGLGEILGGVFGPYGAGLAADAAGLSVTLWIMLALVVASSALALLLKESAPKFTQA